MELERVSADAPNQLLPSHSWEAVPVTCDLQPKIEPIIPRRCTCSGSAAESRALVAVPMRPASATSASLRARAGDFSKTCQPSERRWPSPP